MPAKRKSSKKSGAKLKDIPVSGKAFDGRAKRVKGGAASITMPGSQPGRKITFGG
jgi:hypothetical protein